MGKENKYRFWIDGWNGVMGWKIFSQSVICRLGFFIFVFSFFLAFCFFLKQGYSEILTPTFAATGVPTVSASATPVKKKKPAHVKPINQNEIPQSMQGAHEAEVEKQAELKKAGKIKSFGTPGTGKGWGNPLPPPANFKIKAGDGLAYLSWNGVSGAGQYIVYISENGKNYKRRVFSPVKETSITIGNLTNGKTYYFAIAGFGNREGSRVVQSVVPVVRKK